MIQTKRDLPARFDNHLVWAGPRAIVSRPRTSSELPSSSFARGRRPRGSPWPFKSWAIEVPEPTSIHLLTDETGDSISSGPFRETRGERRGSWLLWGYFVARGAGRERGTENLI